MEEMDQSGSNEIALILDDERFYVNKEKLVTKSQYFSALCSGQYKDSASTEFPIKLKWSKRNLQAFAHWINEDDEHDKAYYTNLESRFKDDMVMEILELIEIAIYFVVDKLVKDLKHVIIKYHLIPKNALILFKYAKSQPLLKELELLTFTICIRRFDELPRDQLLELNYKDYIMFTGNQYLQCDKEFLRKFLGDWSSLHINKIETKPKSFYHITCATLKNFGTSILYAEMLQVAVTYKKIRSANSVTKVFVLYIYNGRSVSELVLHLPFVSKREGATLNGARVLFRDFEMYVIGGQFDYMEFNTDIWKYSFVTNKWYHVTRMPQALRHMTAIFWKNRLYLIGGTARYRLKFENQLYYDLGTNQWSKPQPIEGFFTGQSLACSVGDKIFVIRSLPYYFYPETETWERLNKRTNEESEELPTTEVRSVLSYKNKIILLSFTNQFKSILWSMDVDDKILTKVESSIRMDSIVISKNELIGVQLSPTCIYFMSLYFSSDKNQLRSRYCYKHTPNIEADWQDQFLGLHSLLDVDKMYTLNPRVVDAIFH